MSELLGISLAEMIREVEDVIEYRKRTRYAWQHSWNEAAKQDARRKLEVMEAVLARLKAVVE